MPYASENTLSQNPLTNGIEISQAQYKTALAAQLGGQSITVSGGSLLILSNVLKSVYSLTNKSESKLPENAPTPIGYSEIKPGEFEEWADGAWAINLQLQTASRITAIKNIRNAALLAITHTIADGSIYQVRPSDLPNMSMAIQRGAAEDWILANDSVRVTSAAELQECAASGIEQGAVIWRACTASLRNLDV
jgi:hypothetical protein